MLCQLAHIPVRGQNPYIKHYTVNDGLPSNKVYNVFQDSRKFIWFATDAGAVSASTEPISKLTPLPMDFPTVKSSH
jgi:ligand-binding sensor domain-containing protein